MKHRDRSAQAVADTLSEGRPAPEPGELIPVGRFVAAQGLGGEVRLLPLSDFPERFTRPGERWLQAHGAEARPVRLLAGRPLPGRNLYAVRLEGISDRRAAEALVGQHLLVSAGDRPTLQPGEFHLLDLVGLQVRLLEDPSTPIGTVSDLIHAGNDLLEVELGVPPGADGVERRGPRRLLIPFVEAIVPEVNLEEGWIGLTPPPGLLDL
jgi:16S rRNA processing protein RimM